MTSVPLKTVVKVRHVPPPFRGVGRGTFYTRKLHRGDLLLTDIGPCWYNCWRHEAGFQVRDTANRTTAYDLEGTLMYLVNAGDSAEGAVWPVGYTRSQQRKTTLAWRPNAEYTTVLRRTILLLDVVLLDVVNSGTWPCASSATCSQRTSCWP